MKYAILLLILLGCGAAYLRSEQPNVWNQLVKMANLPSLAVPGSSASSSLAGTDSDGTPGDSSTPPHVVPVQPELITPSQTNYINPDHVHEVEQPVQPSASTNQAGNPSGQ
jgi:hypothetical protein